MTDAVHAPTAAPDNSEEKSRRMRRLRKILILAGLMGVSYYIETNYELYEELHSLMLRSEDYDLDVLLLVALVFSVSFPILQMLDLQHETRRRRAAEGEALILAFHDPLTGLGNRRRMSQALAIVPVGQTRTLMMVDLDDFKPINDIFGHAAGDQVLIAAAERLTTAAGADSLVCRFGGDEFAILTGQVVAEADVELLARQISIAFAEPFAVGEAESQVGTSVGAAIFIADEKSAAFDAIHQADLALYRAKADEFHRFRMFEDVMEDDMRRRKLMERNLRKAMTHGDVRPFFQPLVDLNTNRVIGFEVLARWTDAELGSVPPSDFIRLAEDAGLMTALSDHLLRLACAEAMKWPPHLKLAFNLSPYQLRDKLIGLRILTILAEIGFSPRRLEIEVTENALIADKVLAHGLLTSLREAGVKIAIDDFGTGYSSLNHLREFNFDSLKIDRSFVMSMQEGGEKAVIVKAILDLAGGLGLGTTAEGIEREDQLASLRSSGCQIGQGYLFSKAISGDEALALIEEMEPVRLTA